MAVNYNNKNVYKNFYKYYSFITKILYLYYRTIILLILKLN